MDQGTAPVSPRAPVIVGRDAVLARLRALAGDEEPAVNVVALVGGAGHGKTRVARALAELMRGRGRLVIEGHARAGTAALPLGVFQDALRADRRARAHPEALDDPLASAFPAQLLPELGAGGAVVADERGLLFESACAYFRQLGGSDGVLMVLEDLHWADPSSLALVAYLAESVRGARVLLALTYRPEEAPPGSALADLRSELLRARLADEIDLPPLGEPAVAEMLAGILGSAPDPRATETIFTMSGGIPFLVEELVREATTSGQLDPSSGAWRAEGSLRLPRTVSDLLLARARRLEEEDRGLLSWAAVIGERIDVRLLLGVSDLGEEPTLAGLTRLRDAGLLQEDPTDPQEMRLLFRHALTRQAILDELLSVERRRRHARILETAEVLYAEAPDAPLEELADHALAAGAAERAFRYSLDAALRSVELCGYPEAQANFERALARWEPGFGVEARAALLLAYGRVLARVFRDERARVLLEEARATYLGLGDRVPAALARAATAFSRVYSSDRSGILDELVGARGELRPDDPPDVRLEVLPLLADALWRAGDFRRMADVAAEGLALVPAEPTRRQLLARIQLLAMLGTAQWLTGDADQGRTTLSESYGLARGHRDHLGAGWACLELASLNLSRRAQDAARWADEGLAVSREGGVALTLVWCASLRALVHVKQGQWEHADDRLTEGERALARLGPDPMCRLGLAWLRAERLLGLGAFDQALADLERILPEIDALGDLQVSTRARSALARTRLAVDDPAGAQAALLPAIRGWEEAADRPLPTAPSLLLAAVEAACAAGDEAEAQRRGRELGARVGGPRAQYALALAAAASGGRGPPGAAEAAAAATDALGWRFDAARMRLLAAEALVRAGERGEATALARRALSDFRDMASDGWCGRAEGVLRGLGLRPPARSRRRGGPLSARELEVLQLLATGATNRSIARRLFISEKTAGHHVASIFAKLDVHSRAQAVGVAAQRNLIETQAP